MPDETTPNTDNQSFEIKPEDLQAQPLPTSAPKEEKNPLNTGNGAVSSQPQPAETPPVVTAATPSEPHEINLEEKLQEQLTEASQGSPQIQDKSANTKKYLIIGISILALAVLAFVGYKFFWPISDSQEVEAPTNTLSSPDSPPLPGIETPAPATTPTEEPSEEMKELEEVVGDIKDMSKPPAEEEKYDEAVLEEVKEDDFPSLTLPDETKDDSSPSEEKEEKILR